MITHNILQPPHLRRRPRWDPIIPPQPVYPIFHEAELTPVVHLQGALGSLPAGDLRLALFAKLTPEGTGGQEPLPATGYVRQTISFKSPSCGDPLANSSPVIFKFRSDDRAPALVALVADGRVIMRGRFKPSQIWVGTDPEDDQGRELWAMAGALRLRFS